MKILNLKVNSFGKLQKKEVEFQDHFNIIYGKNESGKSTLLKFILGMFYGLSKNKNGKRITDQEKYTPWTGDDFSGKINYQLKDGNNYMVFREFKKKSPQIYNADDQEISKQFSIDKTLGNRFFYEQTGVEEDLFASTVLSMQDEVILDEKKQASLLQRLSNLVSTGEDQTSFQKVMNALNKRQIEEIGTERTQDRPINMINKRMEQISEEKEYLSGYVEKKYDMEESKQQLEQEVKEQEVNLEILKQVKKIEDQNELEKEKIRINENTIKEYKRKIDELSYPRIKERKNEKKNIQLIRIGISFAFILLSIVSVFLIKNDIVSAITIVLAILSIIYTSYQQYKEKISIHEHKEEENVDKTRSEIGLILTMIENLEKEGETLRKKQEENQKESLEKIRNNYLGIAPIKVIDELLAKKDIAVEMEVAQNKINENKLKIQSIGLDKSSILPKLENLANLEEEYQNLEEEFERLNKKKEAIELAKQEMEQAYFQMKKRVTPKFTNQLSEVMKKISDGKYTNIKLDEKDGMIVELENGNYVPLDYLSIGTIDQLYLSLRLGAQTDIAKEELPIILDEAFAYYDDKRLENILTYLNSQYPDRQILIFSCTKREQEILVRNGIPFNLVEL